ncbi:hypothetical protein MKZ26_10905 [Sporosarcina sp. FSL K6-6792]|uniref:hypothetical protein n=1 Tax=Sporosarcina sp. FSL K6-6792 TaxID=2921559 RepID=UPI0030F597CC
MEYNTDISVTVENGKEKSDHLFKNESTSITRATKLWIKNVSEEESNFFETIKMWYGIDKNTKTTSYYSITTSESTPVESFRKYYVEKINEEVQAVTFAWHGY